MNLAGYKVAVTGGSGGIGSALITGLLDAGATVYNLDRTPYGNKAVEYIEVDLTLVIVIFLRVIIFTLSVIHA